MRPTRSPLTLAATLALLLAPATPAASQTVADLLASVQRGGGWVSVPIVNGTGRVSTATVPTVGLTVSGCVHVWEGHSGRWDISARDAFGPGNLQMTALGGESVPFTYAAGMRSQFEIDFRWSEPRDTTLYLWVGLARPNQPAEATCQPVEGDPR